MQEKKHLEEELNRLRSSALVSSAFFATNPSAQELPRAAGGGACSSEPTPDTDRLASVAEDEGVDSAVEASMVTVQ